MDINEAAHLARRLMNQHGLGHIPFEFDRGKRRIGACHWLSIGGVVIQITKITLSRHYAELLTEDEIRDTILHEIAHALTPGHHHDYVWKAKAREVGAKPNRCAVASASPESKYEITCPNGHNGQAHRLPLRVKSCGKCSPTFDLRYLLVYKEGGRKVRVSEMPARYRQEYQRFV